jgi:hypothetical protein
MCKKLEPDQESLLASAGKPSLLSVYLYQEHVGSKPVTLWRVTPRPYLSALSSAAIAFLVLDCELYRQLFLRKTNLISGLAQKRGRTYLT